MPPDTDAIMREAGLASDSEPEESEDDVRILSSSRPVLDPGSGLSERSNKRQRLNLTDESGFLSVENSSPRDTETESKSSSQMGKSLQSNKYQKRSGGSPGNVDPSKGFDYSAARAAAPGLALTLDEGSARGGPRGVPPHHVHIESCSQGFGGQKDVRQKDMFLTLLSADS